MSKMIDTDRNVITTVVVEMGRGPRVLSTNTKNKSHYT